MHTCIYMYINIFVFVFENFVSADNIRDELDEVYTYLNIAQICQLLIQMYICIWMYEIRYEYILFVLIFVCESFVSADNIRDELYEVCTVAVQLMTCKERCETMNLFHSYCN
jgi:hypothetical protein